MSRIIPNLFTTYELTEEEQLQGHVLTEQQKQVFQNERANLAEERSALSIDSDNVIKSAQEEAYKLGQLDQMSWILDASEASNTELNDPEYNPELLT